MHHHHRKVIQHHEYVPDIDNILKKAGLKTVGFDELYNSIKSLYLDPSIEEVISQEMPRILEIEPDFMHICPIDLEQLKKAIEGYQKNMLFLAYMSPEKIKEDVEVTFKIQMRHIYYFLAESKNIDEYFNTINKLQDIINGMWKPDHDPQDSHIGDIQVPLIFNLDESRYYLLEEVQSAYMLIHGALGFLKSEKLEKIVNFIMAEPTLDERARFTKEVIEVYLRDADEISRDLGKGIPDYYDSSTCFVKYLVKERGMPVAEERNSIDLNVQEANADVTRRLNRLRSDKKISLELEKLYDDYSHMTFSQQRRISYSILAAMEKMGGRDREKYHFSHEILYRFFARPSEIEANVPEGYRAESVLRFSEAKDLKGNWLYYPIFVESGKKNMTIGLPFQVMLDSKNNVFASISLQAYLPDEIIDAARIGDTVPERRYLFDVNLSANELEELKNLPSDKLYEWNSSGVLESRFGLPLLDEISIATLFTVSKIAYRAIKDVKWEKMYMPHGKHTKDYTIKRFG